MHACRGVAVAVGKCGDVYEHRRTLSAILTVVYAAYQGHEIV